MPRLIIVSNRLPLSVIREGGEVRLEQSTGGLATGLAGPHARDWGAYGRASRRFAEVVGARHRPGDHVWVHDYHLMRVPQLVRELVPGARIGFFLHIPFPASEVFRTLPNREQLLEGMLG